MKQDMNKEFSEPLDEYSAPPEEFHTNKIRVKKSEGKEAGVSRRNMRLLRQFFLIGVITVSGMSLLHPQTKSLPELVPIYREIQGYIGNGQYEELRECLVENGEIFECYQDYIVGFDGESCFVIEGKSDFVGMVGRVYRYDDTVDYHNYYYWFAAGDYSDNSINGEVVSCSGRGVDINNRLECDYAEWENGIVVGTARTEWYRWDTQQCELSICAEGVIGASQEFVGSVKITNGEELDEGYAGTEVHLDENGYLMIDDLVYDGTKDKDRTTAILNAKGKACIYLDDDDLVFDMGQDLTSIHLSVGGGEKWINRDAQTVEYVFFGIGPQKFLKNILHIPASE